ncbi:spore coat protein [Candidatus Magnetomorum sp. HK-1]|nr:spore coat protein [Candidatus Magnetomorum sp. HK-1]
MNSYKWHINDTLSIDRVLKSENLNSYCEEVRLWESDFKKWIGWGNAISVSSGTSAIIIGLKIQGITTGDVVALPSLTFAATAQAVESVGAIPLFVDVDPETFVITPDTIKPILSYPKLKGLIGVHLFGNMCPINEIIDLCERNSLFFLEDAAQALGSQIYVKDSFKNKRSVAYSFDSKKHLSIGQGGMIICGDIKKIDSARTFRHCGLSNINDAWVAVTHGTNHLICTLQAALGRSILKRLIELNEIRCHIGTQLNDYVNKMSEMRILKPTEGCNVVPHRWVVLITDLQKKKQILQKAQEENIPLSTLYKPLHMHPHYKTVHKTELKNTDFFFHHNLCLDIAPYEPETQIKRVIELLDYFR